MGNLKKYLAESVLIVFSVLFALFINKLFDDHKTEERKQIALESIQKEIIRNNAILTEWKTHHIAMRDRIKSLVDQKNDSLKNVLLASKYLDLGLLSDQQSLINDILSDTAWESARTTGIIQAFNFEQIELLTKVYKMQEVLIDKTLMNILDLYFNADTHNMKNLDPTLLQLQLRFQELTGQEELMNYLYGEALKNFEIQ
ncbi:MAG: hypothetical protein HKP53_08870 [Eudoraea sp.]|nr:hypothetical protein [Eudoraea sp.]